MTELRILGLLCVLWLGGLVACSEPEENITGSTADGLFAVRMKAEKNWVRAGHDLPIRVTLESLTGTFPESRQEHIVFRANNGELSASSLSFNFAAPDDSLGITGDTSQSGWIIFTADGYASSKLQGEIIALFDDLQFTYKVRFVDRNQ